MAPHAPARAPAPRAKMRRQAWPQTAAAKDLARRSFGQDQIRIPDGRANVALFVGGIVEVVNGYQLPIGSLNGPGISQVPGSSIGAQRDLTAPGLSIVVAEASADAVRRGTVPVRDGEPPVSQPYHRRRISVVCAGIRDGLVNHAPGRAIVVGAVQLDPTRVADRR